MNDNNNPNPIASYVGLAILLSVVGCVILFCFFIYESLTDQRSLDLTILLFIAVVGIIALVDGYGIIKKYSWR